MHSVSGQKYESVWRLTPLPLPPASLPSALCIYFLMIVFWGAVWRRARQWCMQECIDRGGKGERQTERKRKHQPQGSQDWVRTTSLCCSDWYHQCQHHVGWLTWSVSANCWGKLTLLSVHTALSFSAFPPVPGKNGSVSLWAKPWSDCSEFSFDSKPLQTDTNNNACRNQLPKVWRAI